MPAFHTDRKPSPSSWISHRELSTSNVVQLFPSCSTDTVRSRTHCDVLRPFESLSLSHHDSPPSSRTPSPPNFTIPPLEPASTSRFQDYRQLLELAHSDDADCAASSSYHGHNHSQPQAPADGNAIDTVNAAHVASVGKGKGSGPSRSLQPALQIMSFPFLPPRALYSLPGPPTSPTASANHAKPYSLHHAECFGQGPLFEFRHGAYGIPKRHPLAIAGQSKAKAGPRPRATPAPRGMLAAAADFLTGPPPLAPPPPAPPPPAPSISTISSRGETRIDVEALRSVQVGEDAYFLRSDALGVADGVGGWATRPGANPAMFSRLLMHFCSVELSRHDAWLQRVRHPNADAAIDGEMDAKLRKFWAVDPVEVMHRAWERCVRVARREGILGSSTALIAMLRGSELRIANLGDCVLLIIRRGQLLFRSQEQQHSFNFPVQLGMMIKRGSSSEQVFAETSRETASATVDGEDIDQPEDEAQLLKRRRHLGAETGQTAETTVQLERDQEEHEREEKRRAEFKGQDVAEIELKREASKEFDFDVHRAGEDANSTGSSVEEGASASTRPFAKDDSGAGEDDRHTVYVGFDDAHPWDEPRRDCGRWTIRVQKGDIIIVASDGLVDNLFDDDIMEEVTRFAPNSDAENVGQGNIREVASNPYLPSDFSPQLLSEALCSRAKAISQDSKAIISPFQQRATEEGLYYVGGKHDDISVLVAVVGEASEHRDDGQGGQLELRG